MTKDDVVDTVRNADYVRAHEVVHVLLHDRALLQSVKPVLAALYRDGDESQRRCVVNGILEHLFESSGVIDLFGDWSSDSGLSSAYTEAQVWSVWIIKKRAFLTHVASLCVDELRRYGIDARLNNAQIGIDSIDIEWGDPNDPEHLVLDCDDEVVERFRDDLTAQVSLAKYATDRKHWREDEYAAWQHWVELRASALG